MEIIEEYNKRCIQKNLLKRQLKDKKIQKKKKTERVEYLEKAQIVIQELAKNIQNTIEFKISNLVTLALKTVNKDYPEFKAEFVSRRGQTECDLLFVENGHEQKPIGSAGEGAIDIASIGLRIAMWTLNPNRACFILDEPFKNLSADMQEKAGEMLSLLSKKRGLQFIVVSHQEGVNIKADKTFTVSKKKNISVVT